MWNLPKVPLWTVLFYNYLPECYSIWNSRCSISWTSFIDTSTDEVFDQNQILEILVTCLKGKLRGCPGDEMFFREEMWVIQRNLHGVDSSNTKQKLDRNDMGKGRGKQWGEKGGKGQKRKIALNWFPTRPEKWHPLCREWQQGNVSGLTPNQSCWTFLCTVSEGAWIQQCLQGFQGFRWAWLSVKRQAQRDKPQTLSRVSAKK